MTAVTMASRNVFALAGHARGCLHVIFCDRLTVVVRETLRIKWRGRAPFRFHCQTADRVTRSASALAAKPRMSAELSCKISGSPPNRHVIAIDQSKKSRPKPTAVRSSHSAPRRELYANTSERIIPANGQGFAPERTLVGPRDRARAVHPPNKGETIVSYLADQFHVGIVLVIAIRS